MVTRGNEGWFQPSKWVNSAKCWSLSRVPLLVTPVRCPSHPGHRSSLLHLPTPGQHLAKPWHAPSRSSVLDTRGPEVMLLN